jgi:hypothetical protein
MGAFQDLSAEGPLSDAAGATSGLKTLSSFDERCSMAVMSQDVVCFSNADCLTEGVTTVSHPIGQSAHFPQDTSRPARVKLNFKYSLKLL